MKTGYETSFCRRFISIIWYFKIVIHISTFHCTKRFHFYSIPSIIIYKELFQFYKLCVVPPNFTHMNIFFGAKSLFQLFIVNLRRCSDCFILCYEAIYRISLMECQKALDEKNWKIYIIVPSINAKTKLENWLI